MIFFSGVETTWYQVHLFSSCVQTVYSDTKSNKNLKCFVWKCDNFKIRIHNFLEILNLDLYIPEYGTDPQLALYIQRVNLPLPFLHIHTKDSLP